MFRQIKGVIFLSFFIISLVEINPLKAQDTSAILNKTKILETLKSDKAETEKKIAAVEAEIEALKPIKKWRLGGFAAMNMNQSGFVNWASGGTNSISITFLGNAYANYHYKLWSWNSLFDGSWGVLYANKRVRKNEDRFEINSKGGYAIVDKLDISGMARFNTQFTPTYTYTTNNGKYPLTSYFAAPAYLNLALGLDYKPTKYFSLFVSPAAGKFTFVTSDPTIAEWNYGLDTGKIVRKEFGASLRMTLKKDIVKNVTLWTQLDLFNNYTDKDKGNRKNIDIDWRARLDMKIYKFLSANISTQLIYDHNSKINVNANKIDAAGFPLPVDYRQSRVQFREAIGIGIAYKFSTKE
jgi:hypothetical protein